MFQFSFFKSLLRLLHSFLSVLPKQGLDYNSFLECVKVWDETKESCIGLNNLISQEYDIQAIIPVYKTQSTVKQAVESVISQKGNLKILTVIVNDGTPDNSMEELRSYHGHPDIIFISQSNMGLSAARNAGLRNITARYVTFIDSDDWIPDNAFEYMYNEAIRTNADIVQGAFTIVDLNGKPIQLNRPSTDSPQTGLFGYPWGKLYKSSIFQKIQWPKGYWFEDTLNSLIIFPKAKIKASIDENVYYYRCNPEGITASSLKSPKVLDTLWITKQLYEDRIHLDIAFDKDSYEVFLKQAHINMTRIKFLNNKQLNRAVFNVHRLLKSQYFNDFETTSDANRILDIFLSKGYFLLYRINEYLNANLGHLQIPV